MNGKPFWQSKTIWVNVLGALVLLLPEVMALPSLEALRPELGVLLTAVNVALRIVTHEAIEVSNARR